MKDVFIYSNFNFSMKNAGVTRMMYYAQAIANNTTTVYLVSCSKTNIDRDAFTEIYPNIFVLKNNKVTQSFFGTIKFVRNLFKFSQERANNNVFIFYPSPLVYLELISLFYLKFIKKCAVFYELNEIRKYSSAFHKKATIKNLKYAFKKIIFKKTFSVLEYFLRFYDGLICISSTIETYGKGYNKMTLRVPILTNPDLKKEYSDIIYSDKESFNIGFSGKVHPDKENLINFFKVLSRLKRAGHTFKINLCGPIEKKHFNSLLNTIAVELGIKDTINYYGNLNAKELATFLIQQQLLIIPRGYTLQNHYGFSTKLSDYLNHGKPILITDVSDNKIYIKDGENGFIVPPDNNDAMFKKLNYIISNYESIFEKIQKNAIVTSKSSFYYKNFSESMTSFLFKN